MNFKQKPPIYINFIQTMQKLKVRAQSIKKSPSSGPINRYNRNEMVYKSLFVFIISLNKAYNYEKTIHGRVFFQ